MSHGLQRSRQNRLIWARRAPSALDDQAARNRRSARRPPGFRVTLRNRCWSAPARKLPPIWTVPGSRISKPSRARMDELRLISVSSGPPPSGEPHAYADRVASAAAPARPCGCLSLLSQVRNSMGPLNQCPAGHLIMALSRSPPVEHMVYRHLTSAGSPHRTAPSWSSQAGQSRNII